MYNKNAIGIFQMKKEVQFTGPEKKLDLVAHDTNWTFGIDESILQAKTDNKLTALVSKGKENEIRGPRCTGKVCSLNIAYTT